MLANQRVSPECEGCCVEQAVRRMGNKTVTWPHLLSSLKQIPDHHQSKKIQLSSKSCNFHHYGKAYICCQISLHIKECYCILYCILLITASKEPLHSFDKGTFSCKKHDFFLTFIVDWSVSSGLRFCPFTIF